MYNLTAMTSTNGIHKDWETLPRLKTPEQCAMENIKSIGPEKPPSLKQYEEDHPLITNEEYKKIKYVIHLNPDSNVLIFDNCETAIYAKERQEAKKKVHL